MMQKRHRLTKKRSHYFAKTIVEGPPPVSRRNFHFKNFVKVEVKCHRLSKKKIALFRENDRGKSTECQEEISIKFRESRG